MAELDGPCVKFQPVSQRLSLESENEDLAKSMATQEAKLKNQMNSLERWCFIMVLASYSLKNHLFTQVLQDVPISKSSIHQFF